MLRSLILFTTQASLLCSASYVVFMADAQAQDAVSALELVITPTRTPTPIKRVGSSVTVITEKDIEKSHKDTVADLLRNVPGIEIAQSGGQGQISRIFLRGTESNHTLVLIDGVEVNDPSSPDTAFDFAHLTTDNIERIEILRGPQGTLYGSEAIGGVINITTKKGKGLPGATAFVETGSFRHVKAGVGSSGEFGRFNYSAQVSRTNREGFTAVDERLGASEEDGYENTSFSSRVGATLTDTVSAHAAMRYADAEAEYDDGFPLQDANNIGKSQEFSGRGGVDVSLFEGRWKQEFSASYSNIERKNVDGFPRRSEGDRTKLDWLNHVALSPSQLVTLGMETEETTYKNRDNFSNAKASVRNNAVFVQDQLTLGEAFSTALGLRWDDHEEMGDEVTFRVAPSYLFAESGTRLKGSYGTGFKAPSLFELYDSFYGNRNLKPESSRGVDVGVEQSLLAGKLALGTTIFRNDIKDLINSDPVT